MLLVILAIIALIAGIFAWIHYVVDPSAVGAVDGIWGNRMHEGQYGGGWLRSKMYSYAWNNGAHNKGMDPFIISVVGGVLFIGALMMLVVLAVSRVV